MTDDHFLCITFTVRDWHDFQTVQQSLCEKFENFFTFPPTHCPGLSPVRDYQWSLCLSDCQTLASRHRQGVARLIRTPTNCGHRGVLRRAANCSKLLFKKWKLFLVGLSRNQILMNLKVADDEHNCKMAADFKRRNQLLIDRANLFFLLKFKHWLHLTENSLNGKK